MWSYRRVDSKSTVDERSGGSGPANAAILSTHVFTCLQRTAAPVIVRPRSCALLGAKPLAFGVVFTYPSQASFAMFYSATRA